MLTDDALCMSHSKGGGVRDMIYLQVLRQRPLTAKMPFERVLLPQ